MLYFGLSLILAVTIVGMVLGIIGLLIIGFLQDEWERLPTLLKLPAYVYLWLKETAAQLLALAARGLTKGSRLAARFQRISSRFASAVTEREKPVRAEGSTIHFCFVHPPSLRLNGGGCTSRGITA